MMEEGELPELLNKRRSLIAACKKAGGVPDEKGYFTRKIDCSGQGPRDDTAA
jgi:hypothetical protein